MAYGGLSCLRPLGNNSYETKRRERDREMFGVMEASHGLLCNVTNVCSFLSHWFLSKVKKNNLNFCHDYTQETSYGSNQPHHLHLI